MTNDDETCVTNAVAFFCASQSFSKAQERELQIVSRMRLAAQIARV